MTTDQKSFFDNHRDTQVLHFTSDGVPFFERHNAEAHAAHLADKTISAVERNEPVQLANEPISQSAEEENTPAPADGAEAKSGKKKK